MWERWNDKSIPTSISTADQEKPKNFSSQKPHTEHPSRLRSHAHKISGQVNFCHYRKYTEKNLLVSLFLRSSKFTLTKGS
ncbi:hypothetical protein ES319_A12G088600v1 [Gossypium barbadense]|uniref:Uncharacterized protein n=1 Tax=Gossypium barbadense TaxID=3634 RepID=A0A5J5T8C8_GOSBA|nr:hypothetical protein ES319_A12G088600v1 [Gossypium barbadense]